MTTITQITNLFVKHNRAMVSANEPTEWNPAIEAVGGVLKMIDGSLEELVEQGSPADIAKISSILLSVMAEAGQYRHEQYNPPQPDERKALLENDLLKKSGELRKKAIGIAKKLFKLEIFKPLWDDMEAEIFPLLDSMNPEIAAEKFMPFRVIQIGNIAERLYGFRIRTNDLFLNGTSNQNGLLQEIYNRKYLRFGTSGVRGRWQLDFTEERAKQVTQVVCEFLKDENIPGHVGAEDLSGKKMVIGYDSRKNARVVAEWVAEVCLANGFKVDLADRDTPTPALVYYLTDYLNPEDAAGLINCTASHNPPEWQGIKFNPRMGYPAPTNVTDFIAFRLNEMQLLDESAKTTDLRQAELKGDLKGFDPITDYSNWIMDNGNGNQRIPLDVEAIREFFADKFVIVDEMHGAGRGYLTKMLGKIGVRYEVIHAERDPNIPGLDYANPEEPFINGLKQAVKETGAFIGMGLDTDADRFGLVDKGGQYFRPNQILPMLIKYLGVDRGLTGRVIATQTGSPLNEVLAGQIEGNEKNKPASTAIPSYVKHPFYKLQLGTKQDRIQKHTFLVPVGIKYIEEIRRVDSSYKGLNPLPEGWRNNILIGGEESSGLTTRGHVTDKDGIWADLLILDMLAYYAKQTNGKVTSLADVWEETIKAPGCWVSYGGKEWDNSNSGRIDIDAVLEAKEGLIDYFLKYNIDDKPTYEGLEIIYLGGIRYDIAEMQLKDKTGNDQHFLRVRASGTEPINRVYVESSDPEIAKTLLYSVLEILAKLSAEQVTEANSMWRLVDIITQTQPDDGNLILTAVKETVEKNGWQQDEVVGLLNASLPILENRTRKIAYKWLKLLG